MNQARPGNVYNPKYNAEFLYWIDNARVCRINRRKNKIKTEYSAQRIASVPRDI